MNRKQMKNWLLTALIQVGTVFLYFWGVRPLRGIFSEWVGTLIFFTETGTDHTIMSVVREGVTIHTTYILQGTELIFSYAPQFGFFFLIAMFGLNFLRPGVQIYMYLAAFHLFIEILTIGCSYMAFDGLTIGFVAADFLLLYLSPLISLAFILFVVLKHKGKV